MSGLEGGALKVGQGFVFAIIEKIRKHVNYINAFEDNINLLADELESLIAMKSDIHDIVNGMGNSGKLTDKAKLWLARVHDLVNDELMKMLMNNKDLRIAKVMLRLMKTDLKKLVEDGNGEMRDVVVKVMKDITKGKRKVGNGGSLDEKEKQVVQVLQMVMEETIQEFKNLMQNDEKMAIAAMHLLEDHMEKLDDEVAEIIAKAKKTSQDAELLSDNHDEENDMLMNEKKLMENVKNMLKPIGKFVLSEELLKTLPDNVRLGMEAMGIVIGNRKELKAELKDSDNANSHRNSCCCVISYDYFSDRYRMSKAAEDMLQKIKKMIENKVESQDVSRPTRTAEMEAIQIDSASLKSRNELFQKIIETLKSNDVHAVGVFGMGGSGKTMLATEIANSKANGIFERAIMVEISESPNIESIQNQIGDSLDLKLHDVHGISEKAIRLHNKLTPENKLTPKDKSEGRKDEKKILIVLDNIWNKIDLDQIGIPRKYCKLLLTSRTKDVCKEMDVQEGNILQVGLLSKDESEDLFKFHIKKVVTMEYKSIVERLLKKCRGLPIAIVATATSLKGKELKFWQQFADELEKPISCQITGVHNETYSILRTSYEFMASEEKKKFFLLACLSPVGSSISIEKLMRYGIGLDLFQHVNKLSEAMELARTWAEELVSSSMFLKGDSDEYVKIHDIVRESTMSFASKSGINTEGHVFLVDAIPRWICEETFNKYTGISLLAQPNYVPLSGVKADLLQILLIKGNKNQNSVLETNFFDGMTNLKVLEVLFMNFEKGLPKSLCKLKVLKTLHLVECKLGDIKLIGELGSLLVLSLRGSSLKWLPEEIGKLYKLRVLDMSKCRCEQARFPTNVIARLSLLEGLYLVDSSFTEWAVAAGSTSNDTGVSNNGADIDDLTKLEFLNVLEIHMQGLKYFPTRDQFVKNLDKFQISVGQEGLKPKPCQRALMVSEFDVSQELKRGNYLKEWLKRADFLALKSATIKNIVPELDEEGFRHLSMLELSNINSISRICEGKVPTGLFYNLCHLEVSLLKNLEKLLPLNALPQKLTKLKISNCNSLAYIFSEDDGVNMESDIIDLPCLNKLKLDGVSNLRSLIKPSNNDDSPRPIFFSSKVTLTSLKKLSLENNMTIVKLWDKESNLHSFQNLMDVEINGCEEMESIGPPSMLLSLMQLESLTIRNCMKMQQVISDGSEAQEVIKFLNLKFLWIDNMENLECFYRGNYRIAFPHLETLCMWSLPRMTKFGGESSNSRAFFSKTIEFPCLKDLWLSGMSDEVTLLWDLNEGEGQGISSNNPLPNLIELAVGKIKLSGIAFPSLSSLILRGGVLSDAKFLFSSSENEGCVGTFSQFPKLEELDIEVECTDSIEQIVEEDGSTAMLNFCGQLRLLSFGFPSHLGLTSLRPFTSLCELSIAHMEREFLFSSDVDFELFQSLEVLRITSCPRLKELIQGGDKSVTFHFPSLECLNIYSCDKLESLFCGEPNQVVEFPSLENGTVDAMKSFSTRSSLNAPKLKKLGVYDCPEMEWLFGNLNCNADLELLSLENVSIKKCPNLKSFSPGVLKAPKLQLLTVDDKPYPIAKIEDFNHVLQSASIKEETSVDKNDL